MKKLLQDKYKLMPHQKKAIKFLKSGGLISLFTGCVDRDTEYLTPEGWKKICDYKKGDLVAEWNLTDNGLLGTCKKGEIEFKEPLDYIVEPQEYLTRVKTNSIDMVLSDDHKVPYITIEDIKSYKSKTWRELKNNMIINIPRSFTIRDDLEPLNLSKHLIRVLIMQSVDSYKVETTDKGIKFYINVKKEKKKKRVLSLLKNAKISYTTHKSSEGYIEVMYYPPKEICQKGLSILWGANKKQLEFIRDELIFWGGSVSERENVSINHFTGNYKDAEFAQYCFSVLSGYYVSMVEDKQPEKGYKYKIYNVNESRRSFSTIAQYKKDYIDPLDPVRPYKTLDNKMYCFTTSSGYWLARRNGKIFPTGNSGKTLISFSHFYNKKNYRCIYITENNLINNVVKDHDKFYGFGYNILKLVKATPAKRRKTYKDFAEDDRLDFLVMNYHTATNDLPELLEMIESIHKEGDKVLIVLDEVEIARSEDTHFYKTLQVLREEVDEVKGFSATPLKKGLIEIYNIVSLLKGEEVISKKKFYKKYCDISLEKLYTFSHKGKRKGYPVKASFERGEESVASVIIPYWFMRSVNTKGGVRTIEADTKDISLEYVSKQGYTLKTPLDFTGLIIFRYNSDSFSVYISMRENIKGYRNVKKFYKKISKHLFTVSKKDIKELPTFKTKVIEVKRDLLSEEVLKFLYKDEDSLNYATETIAEITPEITQYEYNLIEDVKLKPSNILDKLLKDTYKLYKKKEIVIVFTSYTSSISYIEEVIAKHYKKIDLRVVVGGAKKDYIDTLREDVEEGIPMVILMNEAGIRGLNLQTCRYIKTLTPNKSGGDFLQLLGRISRIGSKFKKVYIDHYIIKDSVLEDQYKIVMGEIALIEELNPELLEKGLEIDKSTKELAIKGKDYLKQKLKNRKDKFSR
jgi:hypothetical protein